MIEKIVNVPTLFLASAVLLAAIWGGGVYYGKRQGRIDQLAATVESYKKRGTIDAQTGDLDDYRLCLAAGGLPEQCDELRGLDTAAKGQ